VCSTWLHALTDEGQGLPAAVVGRLSLQSSRFISMAKSCKSLKPRTLIFSTNTSIFEELLQTTCSSDCMSRSASSAEQDPVSELARVLATEACFF
jgi:hypothetical protein